MDIDDKDFEAAGSGEALLQHADWLRRLARSLVQDAAESDDLVQETWLAALRARATDGRPLKPWLNTVARNFSKRSFRRRERPTADPAQGEIDPGLPDPSDVAEKLEAERRLTEALSALDEPLRSTLFLRFYEDLTSPEIAERTKSPAGTVRWRLKRGLELLRERLDDESAPGTWLALLLPLAATGSPKSIAALAVTAGTASSPLSAIFGALAMNTMTKALVAALALALLYVGLDATSVIPESLSMRADAREVIEIAEAEDMMQVQAAPSPEASRELNELPEPVRSPLGTRAVPENRIDGARDQEEGPWLSARVIDDQGRPLQGVQLAVEDTLEDSRSDERGRVRVSLRSAQDEVTSWGITFAREGYATHFRREPRARGEDVDLGEIVMEPGGSIRGRVIDESGRPISNARIDFMTGVHLARKLEKMRFQYRPQSIPFAHTDPQGEFELAGVSPGVVRLWASTEKTHLPQYSEAVEVRARMVESGVVVILEPIPAENSIQLRVFDPLGEPAVDARIDYSHSSAENGVTSQGTRFTDEEGRLEFVVFSDAVLTGQVVDAKEECSPTLLGNLMTGLGEVRIDLIEKHHSSFVVKDEEGVRVDEISYELRAANGETVLSREPSRTYANGLVEYVQPSDPYLLWVYAALSKVAKAGPIDPESTDVIQVRLERVPGLHGTVKSPKGPLEDARVSLHRAVPEDEEFERNGFRCRYDPSPLSAVSTDAEGRFALTVREPGRYVIRADGDGLAASDSAAFEVMDDLEGEETHLLLERGGSIEGRVLSQESHTDTVVGISRGDGNDRTMRVSEDGQYRFEDLSAGPWRVRLRETEIDPKSTTISRRSGGTIRSFDSLDWDCDVIPGQTTYFDVDPIGRATQVFSGQLVLSVGSPSEWSAQLLPEDAFFPEGNPLEWSPLDGEGRFEIVCDEVGPRLLVLRSAGVGGNELYLTARVNTESNSPWTYEFQSGSLVFEGAPPGLAQGIPQLVMKVSEPNGVEFWATVIGDENGRCEVRAAPLGRGALIRPDLTTLPDFHPESWPEIAEFTVIRGVETLVDVPN